MGFHIRSLRVWFLFAFTSFFANGFAVPLTSTLPPSDSVQATGEVLINAAAQARKLREFDRAMMLADSAIRHGQSQGDPALQGRSYLQKAYVLEAQLQWKAALEACEQSLLLLENTTDTLSKGKAIQRLGILQAKQGHYPEAEVWLRRALAIWTDLQDEQNLAKTQNDLGLAVLSQGSFDSAMVYFVASALTKERLGDTLELAKTYKNIGLLYHLENYLPEAIQYYERALGLHAFLELPTERAEIQLNLGEALGIQGDYKEALDLINTSLTVFTEYNRIGLLSYAFAVRGRIYYEQAAYTQALLDYQKVWENEEALGDPALLLITYQNAGACYFYLKRYPEARAAYQRALQDARQLGMKLEEANALDNLAELYDVLGQNQKAYDYMRQFLALRETILNEERGKAVAEMQEKYNTVVQQQEIAQLEAENALKDEETRHRTQQRNATLIIGGLVVLLSVFLIRNYRQQQRLQAVEFARKEEAHQSKVTQLLGDMRQSSIQAMLDGQERERRRIAQDLHDRLGGMIVAINMQVGKLRRAKSLEEVASGTENAQATIQETGQSVRAIAHNLATGDLKHFGLVPALQNLAESLSSSGQLELEFIPHGLEDRLPTALELDLYQATQELVGNAIKHGKAQEVTVQLLRVEDSLTLMVEDDGQGFDVAAMQVRGEGGLGISGLTERMEKWEAEVDIDSAVGEGTTVSVLLPFPEEEPTEPQAA